MSESFPKAELAKLVRDAAQRGIFVGTSSWKYEGWLGLIYSPEKYMRYFKSVAPKHQKARFEKTCLAEYATVFSTVCLDAGFYQFFTEQMWQTYFDQVPSDFLFSSKVTEDITVRRFPNMPRYGHRAGQLNDRFLDSDLFVSAFLGPLERFKNQVGTLIFEFSHFHPGDWNRGREFVEALDTFFARLPRGWRYAVEVRNESLLQPEYFEVLRRHGVSHTYNSWSRMPSVGDQLKLPGSATADFATARFLLKPGRTYEQAVTAFSPYREIKEPLPETREAMAQLLSAESALTKTRFIYVNNRLEGSALWTIYAVLAGLIKKPIAQDGQPG